MLVLTRKIGEQVIIGDNIRVTVVSVGPGRVKIGIEAPASVSVDRAEIHEKKLVERSSDGAKVGPPTPAEAAIADDVAVLHNRIAGLADPTPVAAVAAVAVTSAIVNTPAPMTRTTVGNPTPAVIRARINRKPR